MIVTQVPGWWRLPLLKGWFCGWAPVEQRRPPGLAAANLSFSLEGAWEPSSDFRFLDKRIGQKEF